MRSFKLLAVAIVTASWGPKKHRMKCQMRTIVVNDPSVCQSVSLLVVQTGLN